MSPLGLLNIAALETRVSVVKSWGIQAQRDITTLERPRKEYQRGFETSLSYTVRP